MEYLLYTQILRNFSFGTVFRAKRDFKKERKSAKFQKKHLTLFFLFAFEMARFLKKCAVRMVENV